MPNAPAVFIGLGSNLGDREATLIRALQGLEQRGFRIGAVSSLYLTEPVDAPPQGAFLNAVARGETGLTPEALLDLCQALEAAAGRVRAEHHGPRTLDLDLLLFGELRRDTPRLRLPHPMLHRRRFVLAPLAEIAPDRRHPVLGLTLRELLAECPDTSQVVRHAPAERLWAPART